MATKFQSRTVIFDSPGTQSFEINFRNTVRDAGGFVQGFDTSFGRHDHHLLNFQVAVQNIQSNDTIVTGEVVFKLEDDSNNKGSATVTVGVAADVEA